MLSGGLLGDELGGLARSTDGGIGTVGSAMAGRHGAASAQGLPVDMLVGVSTDWVYGFAGRSRCREPQRLLFRLPRAGLSASVHARVYVRTLSLRTADGSIVELEGNRLPITHSKDVIDSLT